MPRGYQAKHLKILLDRLSEATSESLGHHGLGQISAAVGNGISREYLYYRLERKLAPITDDSETLKLAPDKIETLVRFLGYQDFNEFQESIERPMDTVLIALEGTYYLYVRKNSTMGAVLRSPAKIEKEKNILCLTVRGADRLYTGTIEINNGCITCLMKAADKAFYHVYRVGKRNSPKVVQGIFAGVSSAFNPIGGRCLLVRQDRPFDELSIEKLRIEELMELEQLELHSLGKYFNTFENNNLRTNATVSFDFDDLM